MTDNKRIPKFLEGIIPDGYFEPHTPGRDYSNIGPLYGEIAMSKYAAKKLEKVYMT